MGSFCLHAAAGAALVLLTALPCVAQTVPPPPDVRSLPPAPKPAAAPPRAASAPAVVASAAGQPNVRVIEDDNVRIEETRVRGQTQRITVQNKVGPAKGYEIIVPAGGKDPSQDRGAAGQRAWSLFAF